MEFTEVQIKEEISKKKEVAKKIEDSIEQFKDLKSRTVGQIEYLFELLEKIQSEKKV